MLETATISWKVAMRHWAIYRKFWFSNILPTVTDPAFFIASFGIGLGSFLADVEGMKYIEFMAPGLATSTALFTAFFGTSYNLYVRLTYDGVVHAMLTTPMGPREMIFGEFIWVGLKSAGMCTGVCLVLMAFGVVHPHYILLVPIVAAIVGLACGAIGLISTGLVSSINQFQTVYALVISPLFFFSGIFFPISQFPGWVQGIAHISPLYHGVRINQMLLWNRPDWALIAMHTAELLVIIGVLGTIGYRLIYKKLET